MSEEEDKGGGRRWSVGDALGDIARRVGEIVSGVSETVSETVTVAEVTREALNEARRSRVRGDLDDAVGLMEGVVELRMDDAFARHGVLLGLAHQAFIFERRPDPARLGTYEDPAGTKKSPATELLRGIDLLRGGDPGRALDGARRALKGVDRFVAADRGEYTMLVHLLAAAAQDALGETDRAIRELYKARVGLPPGAYAALVDHLLTNGVRLLLIDDRAEEAERWVRELHRRRHAHVVEAERPVDPSAAPDSDPNPEVVTHGPSHLPPFDARERAWLARALAARGDLVGARALTDGLEGEDAGETVVRVQLLDADHDAARQTALHHLQLQADDPARLRLWALAELRAWGSGARRDPLHRSVLDALQRALEVAPPGRRPAHAAELAHAALEADELGLIIELGERAARPAELRLYHLRAALRRGEAVADAFTGGDDPRLREQPDVAGPWGPDEVSPLRDPRRRSATLDCQRALALAEHALVRGLDEVAAEALVAALVEVPESPRARALMLGLTPQADEDRLEALLETSTQLLAQIPQRLLGESLEGAAEALQLVIAARERLARPLTIAIMGEFSAGKSSFVNALLGEEVAPTGVLPTTTTINVFRRGRGGGARVHHRDGSISTLATDQVQPFLHGLDDVAATRIRFVEIERTGARMGDAAVVDTPGLNALDAYHEKVAREFLDQADAVVWVFSATRGGTASEADMLRELREGGRQVLGVLNKCDTLEPHEQQELAQYLREQLGEVLVEVVPLSATAAVAWRIRSAAEREGPDPFTDVEAALERRFLTQARDLKRGLVARRLDEALLAAGDEVRHVAERLEARAERVDDGQAEARSLGALQRFAAELETSLLALDDFLTRESLGLGVVEIGRGVRPLDALDLEYLEAQFEEAALARAQTTLRELAVGVEDRTVLGALLTERFVPWARGYLAGARGQGFVAGLVRQSGKAAARGESALREAFRADLMGLVEDWTRELLALRRPLELAMYRDRRRRSSEPRAQALRLRASILASIEGLRARLGTGEHDA